MRNIYLQKGRIFRLAFPDSIKKGEWYVGAKCKGCEIPILMLNDPYKGGKAPKFEGEGKISMACPFCGLDTLYEPHEMRQFKSTYDLPSFREKRPKPSGSPRQPFLPKYAGLKPTVGIGALEQRPEAAQVIARCIAYWTNVEAQTARLLATILKANTKPAIALYLSLQNARAKSDAMNAAAKTTLSDEDYELFEALMAYKQSVEKERNAIAHGIFGVNAKIETGVLWIDTTSYAQYTADVSLHGVTDELYKKHLSNFYVYELGDLETVAREIENLHDQIGFVLGYFSSDDADWRAARYPQLCSEPRLRRELDRLRQRPKNDSSAQAE